MLDSLALEQLEEALRASIVMTVESLLVF